MIPKIIHQIWLGSEIPKQFLGAMADWSLLNEGWKYMLWTAPLPDMWNQDLYDGANNYVKPDAVWQMRSDLLRYEILYRYGGFYADVDTVPHRPLGDLFDGLTEWAVMEDSRWISNTYLATVPASPLFDVLIKDQVHHAYGKMEAAAGVVTGPQYLTPIWNTMFGHVDTRTELWHPYSWSDVRRRKDKYVEVPADAYATHLWAHSRDKLKRADQRYRDNRKVHGS